MIFLLFQIMRMSSVECGNRGNTGSAFTGVVSAIDGVACQGGDGDKRSQCCFFVFAIISSVDVVFAITTIIISSVSSHHCHIHTDVLITMQWLEFFRSILFRKVCKKLGTVALSKQWPIGSILFRAMIHVAASIDPQEPTRTQPSSSSSGGASLALFGAWGAQTNFG